MGFWTMRSSAGWSIAAKISWPHTSTLPSSLFISTLGGNELPGHDDDSHHWPDRRKKVLQAGDSRPHAHVYAGRRSQLGSTIGPLQSRLAFPQELLHHHLRRQQHRR